MSGTGRSRAPRGRPRRRPSQAVFWRRRLVLLGVLAVLVWGLTRVVGGGDEPSAAQTRPTAPTTTPTATASAQPTATPTPKQRTRKVVDSQATLAAAASRCDPATLAVRPAVPGGAFTGGPVALRLAMTTSARAACTLDLADVDLLVDVARDGDSVWSTQTCAAAVPQRSVQLDPTWATTLDVTWSGRRAGDECAADEKLLPAGPYRVRAAVLGGEPGESDFTLRDRPKPTPTASPSPSPAAKPAAKPAAEPTPTAGPTSR